MTRALRDGQVASGAQENLLFQGVEWALCKTHLMLPSRARLPAKLPPVLLDSVAIPPCIGVPLIQPGLCCFWYRDENLSVDAAPNTPQADVVEREREREREERERKSQRLIRFTARGSVRVPTSPISLYHSLSHSLTVP